MGAAYKAKLLCSNTFIARRAPKNILRNDLNGPERIISSHINYSQKYVTASLPGIPEQKAIYVPNLGCILLAGNEESDVRQRTVIKIIPESATLKSPPSFTPPLTSRFDQQQLTQAIDKGFAEPDQDNSRQTRAILVVHKGRLLAENYAPGFSSETPLLGWSMTKSVINALVGILVRQGKLSIDQATLVPEWSDPADPRAKITLDQMLRMSSGLEFDETSGAVISDVTTMLLRRDNAAAYAIAKPLQYPPDKQWHYASGTTNIISRIVRMATGGSPSSVVNFLHKELFQPLGIKHAVIEADASGNLIGSSFMYATAREWARFGQLYLQDGEWNGKQLLPQGWVNYSTIPTPAAPQGQYGAHFWTNGGIHSVKSKRPLPKLPGDLYYASGYKGQRLIIIPSHQLVIVRMGWSDAFTSTDMQNLVTDILEAQR